MNNTEDSNNDDQDLYFYLDPSIFDLKIVKRIGIEKTTNSLIVGAFNQIIIQTIRIESFSDKTISPLRKQLSEILAEYKNGEDRQKLINSIVTCINSNIEKISEYCKTNSSLLNNYNGDENSIADNLIRIALKPENTEKLFKDQYGKVCAAVRPYKDRHLEILSIDSVKYKRYLSKLYRGNIGPSIGEGSINTAVTNLASEAEFDGEIIPLHLRVAWGSDENRSKNGYIYYDICDAPCRIIEISDEGWRIINGTDKDIPIIFKRFNQQAQVDPDRNYEPDILENLLNLTNVKNKKHRHLLKVYIVSILIPEIDHVILTTYGPKGSAKSFLLELIKKLVDPTRPTLLTLQRNVEQFIQQVNHNYINYYDNVKSIPYWLSDEICKAVTGIGHSKRELYSNDNDIIYEHRRCLGLNGINVALTEADALDRSISIELEDIDEDKRRKESDLWFEFEKIKPQAFAYILDVIVKAIQIKPTLNMKRLPRMADFAEWGEAISQAMEYPPMSFIEVYTENRNEQNIVAVNENFVSSMLLRYILNIETEIGLITKIQFEPQELYNELVEYAGNNGIRIDGRQLPKDAASLVKKIKTVIPNLKAGYGINVEIGRSEDNTSIITISRKTVGDKTIISDDNYNSPTGGTESLEPIFTKSIKDGIYDVDNSDSDSIDNNTKDSGNSDEKLDSGGDNIEQ